MRFYQLFPLLIKIDIWHFAQFRDRIFMQLFRKLVLTNCDVMWYNFSAGILCFTKVFYKSLLLKRFLLEVLVILSSLQKNGRALLSHFNYLFLLLSNIPLFTSKLFPCFEQVAESFFCILFCVFHLSFLFQNHTKLLQLPPILYLTYFSLLRHLAFQT